MFFFLSTENAFDSIIFDALSNILRGNVSADVYNFYARFMYYKRHPTYVRACVFAHNGNIVAAAVTVCVWSVCNILGQRRFLHRMIKT